MYPFLGILRGCRIRKSNWCRISLRGVTFDGKKNIHMKSAEIEISKYIWLDWEKEWKASKGVELASV